MDLQGLLCAPIQQADPLLHRFLRLCGREQIPGLQYNFQCIAQVMHESANLRGKIRGNAGSIGRWRDRHAESLSLWVVRFLRVRIVSTLRIRNEISEYSRLRRLQKYRSQAA